MDQETWSGLTRKEQDAYLHGAEYHSKVFLRWLIIVIITAWISGWILAQVL